MKNILLIITLSLFIYQVRCVDFGGYQTKACDFCNVSVHAGRTVRVVPAKKTDTIRTVIDNFYRLRNSVNRGKERLQLVYFLRADELVEGNRFIKYELVADQLVEACGFDLPSYVDLTTDLSINVTCRTLTGQTFQVQWKLFDSVTELIEKIVDEQLVKIQPGYKVRFIHVANRLNDDICADQVEGLFEDPNLTIIMEPIRR